LIDRTLDPTLARREWRTGRSSSRARGANLALIVALVVSGVGCTSRLPDGSLGEASPESTAGTVPPPSSQAVAVASLTFEPTGIVPCGSIPAFVCTFFIEIEGPDGVAHEGYFDVPLVATPPTYATLGDVPSSLSVGWWQVTFLDQEVTDIVSFEPVPGGTPRATNRGPIHARCDTGFAVTGPAHVRIHVAFAESACKANAEVTPAGG
jgi:hypothetical protein